LTQTNLFARFEIILAPYLSMRPTRHLYLHKNLVTLLLIVLATATSNVHAACTLANITETGIIVSFVDGQMNSGKNVISGGYRRSEMIWGALQPKVSDSLTSAN
jgi:hypothetical protein